MAFEGRWMNIHHWVERRVPKRPRGIFSVFNFAPYLWWTKLGSSDHIFCFCYKYTPMHPLNPSRPLKSSSDRLYFGKRQIPNFNYWLRDISHSRPMALENLYSSVLNTGGYIFFLNSSTKGENLHKNSQIHLIPSLGVGFAFAFKEKNIFFFEIIYLWNNSLEFNPGIKLVKSCFSEIT